MGIFGSPRAEAQFRRAQWSRWLLFPMWALQMILSVGILGLFSWRIGYTLQSHRIRNITPTIEYV